MGKMGAKKGGVREGWPQCTGKGGNVEKEKEKMKNIMKDVSGTNKTDRKQLLSEIVRRDRRRL